MIVITFPSVVKPSVVSTLRTPVSLSKLSVSHAVSPGLSADVSELSRKHSREDDSSSAAVRQPVVACEEMLKFHLSQPA